jgi:hypothetical protein
MQEIIEQTIERVEQLYATIIGQRPPLPSGNGAPIPPESDPLVHVSDQLERMVSLATQLIASHRTGRTNMETVKVDIQKLQLLNDRITQTIEALNQVRLSMHTAQQPSGTVSPWGVSSPYGQSYGFSPYAGQPQFQPSFQPGYGTPFIPYAVSPFVGAHGYGPQSAYGGIQHVSPSQVQPQLPGTWGTYGFATPWSQNGISHSTWDPTWQQRMSTWCW